jgi:hypothetical protein
LIFLYDEEDEGFSIIEKYTIKAGPIITKTVGFWSMELGLQIPISNIWERRANLCGALLLDVILPYSIFMRMQKNKEGKLEKHSGISPDIMAQLGQTLNFSVAITLSKDGTWGRLRQDNISWTGVMGMLMNKEIDVCSSGTDSPNSYLHFIRIPLPVSRTHSFSVHKDIPGAAFTK